MTQAVVAFFDQFLLGEDAVEELKKAGFELNNISIIPNSQVGEQTIGRKLPENDSQYYADDIRRGGAIVTVFAGERAAAAREILDRAGAHSAHLKED